MFHLGNDPDGQRLLRSRLYLVGLFLAFLGPLLAATVIYQDSGLREKLRGESHGSLILPPRPLPRAWFGEPGTGSHWTLLYYAQSPRCDLHCEADLFLLRQVWKSLGSLRVRTRIRVLLDDSSWHVHYREHLRGINPSALHPRPASFPESSFDGLPPDSLYLVDPLGNLLMYYGDDATARGMLGDIKRLLKASRIG